MLTLDFPSFSVLFISNDITFLKGSQTMLLNLEQLTISLDIPNDESNSNSHNSPCSFKDLDDWDVWVKCEYIFITTEFSVISCILK